MNTFWRLFPIVLLCGGNLLAQVDQDQLEYIETYKDIAIREMERAGIPASIKLAQAILESNAGRSTLAQRANNHFGIKCGANWDGRTFYREDDDFDAEGNLIKSCFRVYRTAEASFIGHSEFLRDPQKTFRYGFLFRLDPKDYRRWAHGLKQAGYATSASYPERLISLIERYELFQYDEMSLIDIDTPAEVVEAGILQNNDVRFVLVSEGETLQEIAQRVDVSVRNLISYNETLSSERQRLDEGERIYLQPKRNGYRGRDKYHVVTAGENMMDISQDYAVRLDKLLRRNRLEPGQEPAALERIKLRGCRIKDAPRLRSEAPAQPVENLEMEEPDETETETDRPPVISDVIPPRRDTSVQEPTTPPARPTTPRPEDPGTVRPNPNPEVPVIIINRPPSDSTRPATPPTPPPVDDPLDEPVFDPEPSPPSTPPANTPQYHTVQRGDTLWNIAQRYDLTVTQLKSLNNLTSDTIAIGQRLRVK